MNLSILLAARLRRAWRRFVGVAPAIATILAMVVLLPTAAADAEAPPGRTIVVGFDGMDPKLTEAWMAEGFLPNFAKLRDQGHFQPLPTTNPAQSPVAWSSFATGLNPGAHAVAREHLRRGRAGCLSTVLRPALAGNERQAGLPGLRLP